MKKKDKTKSIGGLFVKHRARKNFEVYFRPSTILGLCLCFCSSPTFAGEKLSNLKGENPQQLVSAANDTQIRLCAEKGEDFKHMSDQEYFLQYCFDHFLAAAPASAVKQNSDASNFPHFIRIKTCSL